MKIEGQGAEILRFLVRVHKQTDGRTDRPSSTIQVSDNLGSLNTANSY